MEKYKKIWVWVFIFVAGLASSSIVARPGLALEGLWKAYDDQGVPTGYIRIDVHKGIFTGVIERGVTEDQPEQFCTACKDERKDKKLIGMVIIKGVKKQGEHYLGEEILDPFSGKTYRVKLTLIKKAQALRVRGYIGLSLFGRTQIWERVENGK